MNPAEQAATAYCSVLHGALDGLDSDGYELTLLTLPDRKVRWLSDHDPAATAAAIRDADQRPGVDAVYLSMGLAAPGTPHVKEGGGTRRTLSTDIGAATHLWVDLDVAGPNHTSGKRLFPDESAIRIVLAELGCPPTMLVRTGGGLHAYWVLAEPVVFADEPDPVAANREFERLVQEWQATIAMHAHRLGRWQIDSTYDLARVLRAVGSTNRRSDPPARVEIVEVDETRRYGLDDLREHLADAEYLAAFASLGSNPANSTLTAEDLLALWSLVNSREYRDRGYMPEWLDICLDDGVLTANDPLVKVWREGHSSGDDSSTDASLARRVADLALAHPKVFGERDAAEIIMCARLRSGAKLEKVDPRLRTDYVLRTVGGMFASARKAAARKAEMTAQGVAAVAAQDAATRPTPPAPVVRAAAAENGAHGLGGAVVAALDDEVLAVRPTPTPVVEDPAEPAADETTPDAPPADSSADSPADPPPASEHSATAVASVWGVRSESTHIDLEALTATLLGPVADKVKIWRCQYRGRGAKQERRVVLRVVADYQWPGLAPEGYVPGQPLAGGWFPASTFNKLAGWLTALRQDLLLVTQPVKADDFTARFGDSLVRVWEPDTSGGSLANVTRDAMLSYLLDFPPLGTWNEAAAQGMPWIRQAPPMWQLDSPFAVLIRWADFGRHVRTHFGVNVTPAVLAEMAELSGSMPMRTVSQDGRWRKVRREYLTDADWRAILLGGEVAEQQRSDKHGMTLVGGVRPARGGDAADPAQAREGRPAGAR